MAETFKLGAVAYDPKVVTIWDGFKDYFRAGGLAFDYVLYSNYEAQVEAHLAGHIDVAWNSPLAWIQTVRALEGTGRTASAVAMRDTDRDLTSVIVTRANSPIASIEDLRGRTVAVGAHDSPQARAIPLLHLAEGGLEPGADFTVQVNDAAPGKHGDHIGGERDAALALARGEVDAACMIDGNHLLFLEEGALDPGVTRILARTDRYDHCNFTLIGGPTPQAGHFTRLLFAMRYDDPAVRPLLDLEGLKRWETGRTSGYGLLERAVERFGAIDRWLAEVAG